MVELVVLTSGALAAGFALYQYFTPNARALQTNSGVVESPTVGAMPVKERFTASPRTHTAVLSAQAAVDSIPRTAEAKEELQRGFNASSISLGLASAGLIFLPPLQYATVPALIYMGTPSAQQAYVLLYEKGKPGRALAETALLAICLGGGWYLAGSLGFWLYYLGRLARHNRTLAQQLHPLPWALPQTVRRRAGAKEALVPTATLQLGDEVLVETSDIIPVDGVISAGAAWVQPAGSSEVSSYCLKRIGDRVAAADIVIAGRLTLCVQKRS